MEKKPPPERLYRTQHDVYNALQDFFLSDQKAGYVRLPTGVGKTVLFSHMLYQLHKEYPDYKSVIVTSRQVLLEQTRETLEVQAGFPREDVGVILEGHIDRKRDEMLKKKTVILTYPMLLKMVSEGRLKPEEVDAFIFDEAHHALGKKSRALVESLQDLKCKVLGFTATPHYSQEKSLDKLLVNEIYNMSLTEALEKDLICSFSVMLAKTHADLSGVTISARGDYDEESLQKAINVAERNQGAVELYKQAFAGRKGIAYCAGITHAESVNTVFAEAGVPSAVISSKTPRKDRKKILDEHKAGKILVLCNADLLVEGYDDPEISVAINLRPTLSKLLAEQRGGRVIRRNPREKDKHAYIVDFVDTDERKRHCITFAEVVEHAGALAGRQRRTDGKYEAVQESILREREGSVNVEISGLQVVVNAEEVMRFVHKKLAQIFIKATNDEYTVNALARTLRLSTHRVETLLKEAHMLGEQKLDKRGNVREHYSHTQLCALELLKRKLPYPPTGWITMRDIAHWVGLEKPGSALEMIRRLEKSKPEVSSLVKYDCIGPNGLDTAYCDPAILTFLPSKRNFPDKPPNVFSMWEVCNGDAIKGWHPKRKGFEQWLNLQRDAHPEWFVNALGKNNQPFTYFTTDAIQAYRQSLIGYAGAEYSQLNDLACELGISRTTARNWAIQLGGGADAIISLISPHNSQKAGFVSSVLAEEIRRYKVELLPKEGEVSLRAIARDLGVSVDAIITRLKVMGVEEIPSRWDDEIQQLSSFVVSGLEGVIRQIVFRKRRK